jgi:4-alpha-glucanotransferase
VIPVETALHPDVLALADELGVETRFKDWLGNETQVPADTVIRVLAALGVAASTPTEAAAALSEHRMRPWRSVLPPSTVVQRGVESSVLIHAADETQLQVWIELEADHPGDSDSAVFRADPDSTSFPTGRVPVARIPVDVGPATARRDVDGLDVAELPVAIPPTLPLGWHTLVVRVPDGRTVEAALVVTPPVLELPGPASARSWGWLTQLYQVRSSKSWGIGDLRDLADLATWSGRELGAEFVLVNPLHASAPATPVEPSPYLPATRRFPSPLYLRVEQIPEYELASASVRAEIDAVARTARQSSGELLDRDFAWTAKLAALELLAGARLCASRAAEFDAFAAREGEALEQFATWCALVEAHGPSWRDWPMELRDSGSSAVAAERIRLAERITLFARTQWWMDTQLEAAQQAARTAGMGVGIVHDLAVGVHPDGFDTWHLPGVLAAGIRVGAPPDAYNQQGQDWLQPPLRPDALARLGYAPYRDMLRAVLRHGGGVRIDHIAGLFRLWWIPEGMGPRDGTYVKYDHEAMVGILALEAQRAGALVVGEDLGTVETWVCEYLADRGIAGTGVLWFEHDQHGRPLPPEDWRPLRLASVTTHDLPPTAGFLAGEHVRLRAELGLLTQPVEVERAYAASHLQAWLDELRARHLLPADADTFETVEALYRYVAATPSRWIGVALVDAVGDIRAQNQPGTSDAYPNWRIPLARPDGEQVLLDDLFVDDRVRLLVRSVAHLESGERADPVAGSVPPADGAAQVPHPGRGRIA